MTTATQTEALNRAQNNLPCKNDVLVMLAAEAAGIPDADPRHNVLTFNAWKAKGRVVRKGQRALCKLTAFYTDKKDGKSKPRTVAVFHISQTDRLSTNGRK